MPPIVDGRASRPRDELHASEKCEVLQALEHAR